MNSDNAMTVSQINTYLSFRFKEDNRLKSCFVRGEVSNYTRNAISGHIYLSLKDSECTIRAIIFKNIADNIKFEIKDGMVVIVNASVEVYDKGGIFQLKIRDIEPSGVGGMYLALKQLKQKLADEGLFDEERKKPLPAVPRKIAAVTAKSGDAVNDILSVTARRAPYCEIVIFPVSVQGQLAEKSIVKGLMKADESDCDVIILARGGGSSEDLNCFNSEKIARCISACKTPVISAVGHEADISLADLVADKRASTPSVAAEIAAMDKKDLLKILQNNSDLLYNNTLQSIYDRENKLNMISKRFSALSVERKLTEAEERLKMSEYKLKSLTNDVISRKFAELGNAESTLRGLNPLAVLLRGYSLIYKNNALVTSSTALTQGDEVMIKLGDGEVIATITSHEGKAEK